MKPEYGKTLINTNAFANEHKQSAATSQSFRRGLKASEADLRLPFVKAIDKLGLSFWGALEEALQLMTLFFSRF